ncbi:hypothetical protein BN844_3913 [Pseudomonas sp. SHC52]|nr:hypothetical protein BN844_3913 [Pseudomonas sp. SHC52]
MLELLAHSIGFRSRRPGSGLAQGIRFSGVRQPRSPLVYRGVERHNSRAFMAM